MKISHFLVADEIVWRSAGTLMAMVENALLGPADPVPFELVNQDNTSPVLVVCEHAGRAIPARLGQLGLPERELERHIAWDIGAADVSRTIAETLGCPLILQPYCRLVIDCNRPVRAADSIPEISDHTVVPGNLDLNGTQRNARIEHIYTPFHNCIDGLISRLLPTLLISIHSFTPNMNGLDRPWDIGLLFKKDRTTGPSLKRALYKRRPGLSIAFNQPYSLDYESDHTVPVHGEARGLSNVLIEIRNDHLLTSGGRASWGELLADCLVEHLAEIAA